MEQKNVDIILLSRYNTLCYEDEMSLVPTGGGYGEAVNTADCGSVTRGFDPHYSPHNLHT